MSAIRLAISTGEPAGIGPDLCAAIACRPSPHCLVFLGDAQVIAERAALLGLPLRVVRREAIEDFEAHEANTLQVLPVTAPAPVQPGRPDGANAAYVLDIIERGASLCHGGDCDALVTAPIQKSVIVEAGVPFSGHTEYLARLTGAELPVMLLTSPALRVALATTHLPLREVPDALTIERLVGVLNVLNADLATRFGIAEPRILVLGLNPHAGESGTLGSEEIEVIEPAIRRLRDRGLRLTGPVPADTAFTAESLASHDAVLAMYHDQGLPVIKAQGFGEIVNVTLGLPIIRTSVDHGTALSLAGTGDARPDSMQSAIDLAAELARSRHDRPRP